MRAMLLRAAEKQNGLCTETSRSISSLAGWSTSEIFQFRAFVQPP